MLYKTNTPYVKSLLVITLSTAFIYAEYYEVNVYYVSITLTYADIMM